MINNRKELPGHWDSIKLKYAAIVSFSSVDRHSEEGFLKVRICHYSDAYKNEKINSESNISQGFCSEKQLLDFGLTKGRIVITKDSESANDIGVPVLVEENVEGGVVGYHLAIIDVDRSKYIPDFLFRVIQSKEAAVYFELNSNGVTRFGLGKPAIENIKLPIPPLEEQVRIANYLDCRTTIIDKLIFDKEQTIELLKEQRQAIIDESVTKGLDSKVKMKNSGFEWLGKIPEDWELVPLRYLGTTQNGVSKGRDYFGAGSKFISYSDVYKNLDLNHEIKGLALSTKEDQVNYSVLEGDVLFTRTSETIEEIGYSSTCMNDIEEAVFAGFLIRFRPNSNRLVKEFSKYYFRSFVTRVFFVKEMNLVTRASLSQDLLKGLPVCLPSRGIQLEIGQYLEKKEVLFNKLYNQIKDQIDNLKSYRQSLISEAVTGKIDLRDWEDVEE